MEQGAHVVVLNRSSDRADAALQSLTEACTGDGRVTSVPCDLLSFDSVRDAGAAVMATLEAEGVGLDGLVCNAGTQPSPHQLRTKTVTVATTYTHVGGYMYPRGLFQYRQGLTVFTALMQFKCSAAVYWHLSHLGMMPEQVKLEA